MKKHIAFLLSVCLFSAAPGEHASFVHAHPESALAVEAPAVPPAFGKVEEFYKGAGDKFIFYIQDAHQSLEAQENIAGIIEHLVSEHGVRKVYEEGYEGLVPTGEYFGFIREADLREKVSYFFMDKLRIGGAEYAHINRKKDFDLIGADSFDLHRKNIERYREHIKLRDHARKDLATLAKHFRKLADRHFPRPLKEWCKFRQKLGENKMNVLEYVKRIREMQREALDEKEFSFRYPLLEQILDAGRNEDIDFRAFFRELDRLENDFAGFFLENDRDRSIFKYLKTLDLLDRLNQMKVTPSEYEVVRTSLKNGLNTDELAAFLAQETGKPVVFSKRWERSARSPLEFYEIARLRDEAVEKKMDEFLALPGKEHAALVFGGFHADNIREILKRKNISYAIISPAIGSQSLRHESYYEQLMGVGRHSFELFSVLGRAARPEPLFVMPEAKSELLAVYQSARRHRELPLPVFIGAVERDLRARVRSEMRAASRDPDAARRLKAKRKELMNLLHAFQRPEASSPDKRDEIARALEDFFGLIEPAVAQNRQLFFDAVTALQMFSVLNEPAFDRLIAPMAARLFKVAERPEETMPALFLLTDFISPVKDRGARIASARALLPLWYGGKFPDGIISRIGELLGYSSFQEEADEPQKDRIEADLLDLAAGRSELRNAGEGKILKASPWTPTQSRVESDRLFFQMKQDLVRRISEPPQILAGSNLESIQPSLEVETWMYEDDLSLQSRALIRIGYLFFADEMLALPPGASERLGGNLIRVENLDASVLGSNIGAYTAATVAALMQTDLQESTFVDLGAGDGILSLAALRLGSAKAVAFEIEGRMREYFLKNLELNGMDSSFWALSGENLKNQESVLEFIAKEAPKGKPLAMASNIGHFSDYEITNQDMMAYIPLIEETTGMAVHTFIGGGARGMHPDMMRLVLEDEELRQDRSILYEMFEGMALLEKDLEIMQNRYGFAFPRYSLYKVSFTGESDQGITVSSGELPTAFNLISWTMTRRAAAVRSELRAEGGEPIMGFKSLEELKDFIDDAYGSETPPVQGKRSLVYQSEKYPGYVLKVPRGNDEAGFWLNTRPLSYEEYRAVRREMRERNLTAQIRTVAEVRLPGREEAVTVEVQEKAVVLRPEHGDDPEIGSRIADFEQKLWESGFFDSDFLAKNRGFVEREGKNVIVSIDTDETLDIRPIETAQDLLHFLNERGGTYLSPGEKYLLNLIYFGQGAVLRRRILGMEDEDTELRRRAGEIFRQAISRTRQIAKTYSEEQHQHPSEEDLEAVRRAYLDVIDAPANRPVFDALLKKLAGKIWEARLKGIQEESGRPENRSELRADAQDVSPDFDLMEAVQALKNPIRLIVDFQEFSGLTPSQRLEYEIMAALYPRLSVHFYRMPARAERTEAQKTLISRWEEIREPLGYSRVTFSTGDAAETFARHGNIGQVIHLSRDRIYERGRLLRDWVPDALKKRFHFFRYRGSETGLLAVALAYTDSQLLGITQDENGFLTLTGLLLEAKAQEFMASLVYARAA